MFLINSRKLKKNTIYLGMGSLQNIGNRGSNAAQQLAAQLSRSGGSSNPGVHAHQQNMLGGSGVGSGSSWGTGKKQIKQNRQDWRNIFEAPFKNVT